jgi:hypothetical protein
VRDEKHLTVQRSRYVSRNRAGAWTRDYKSHAEATHVSVRVFNDRASIPLSLANYMSHIIIARHAAFVIARMLQAGRRDGLPRGWPRTPSALPVGNFPKLASRAHLRCHQDPGESRYISISDCYSKPCF